LQLLTHRAFVLNSAKVVQKISVTKRRAHQQKEESARAADGGLANHVEGRPMADTTDPSAARHVTNGTGRSVVGHACPERERHVPAIGQPEESRLGAVTGRSKTAVPADWRSRTVVSVPLAGKLLDLSRQGAYDAANRGELPAIRIGRRLVVPVVKLRRLLGELPTSEEPGRRPDAE
jgi:hypothetical protein